MTSIKDIYWLAGILEGEGCFSARENGYPTISIEMQDKDIVDRVSKLFNTNSSSVSGRHAGYKVTYITSIRGDKAIGWMFTLFPVLGTRRRTRIKEIVHNWKNRDLYKKTYCPNGHEYPIDHKLDYNGHRRCKECTRQSRIRAKEFRARRYGS